MSISATKIVNFLQTRLNVPIQDDIEDFPSHECKTLGGVLSNKKYTWLSNGPRLEVIDTKTGNIVGKWTFGWIVKDCDCQVVFVDEIQRLRGRPPLLAVGVQTSFYGGIICIFDFLASRVIRTIKIKEKLTSLHVIDAGYDGFTLPGPLRTFDGIIAIGVAGGNVFLIDICRQICEEALTTPGLVDIRDELNPCELNVITSKDIGKIEMHKAAAVKNSQHLSIHLNVVFDKLTKHFVLKGPKGDDRLHVNKEEVTVSALYYCPQLGSILIGFNFGALQLFNLINLDLVYTSPVCDEHIPLTHFAFQEPSDDPRAFCYIWSIYSTSDYACLPLAVMYVFCYETKEYHEGYGFLYEDFNTAAIHYQMELAIPACSNRLRKFKRGYCLSLNSNHNDLISKKRLQHDTTEENLPLCAISWTIEFNNNHSESYVCVFDLNQWYKAQMPKVFNSEYYQNYMLQICINEAIPSNDSTILDIVFDTTVLKQFIALERPEEHFYPSSLSFDLMCLRENDLITMRKTGIQQAFLSQIKSSGPLCLVEPANIYSEIINLRLLPVFEDISPHTPITTHQQREIILGTALENNLINWLCNCASEWANGSCLAAGCSLDLIISWAFERAITLKKHSFDLCVRLFDFSGSKLDNNTIVLLNNTLRQLNHICLLYKYILEKLPDFVSNPTLMNNQYGLLQQVSMYFKVLQWFYQVGLLPETQTINHPDLDESARITAPYPFDMLNKFYTCVRNTLLNLAAQKSMHFPSKSVLYIDNLIEQISAENKLEEQWRSDGGDGFYPPPSIQSLLKTYLLDGVDYSQIHFLMVYFSLDLVTALDAKIFQAITTYLNKFSCVFELSLSVVKIIQAFWHLDHDNAKKAVELILSPMVKKTDLKEWHHKVILRLLLLQNQNNYALRYIQIMKPPINDDEDVLMTITLYISNNMFHEAMRFKQHYASNEKYLTHFFNECAKHKKLKSLIYNKFSQKEEELFLKYLKNRKDLESGDLLVSYHILRAQYFEAFDTHERILPHKVKEQGLVGQVKAMPRDKLINCVKQTLPGTYKKFLETCKRDKNNLFENNATNPTPMSEFFHNPKENALFKSNVIGASIAKAKQTFSLCEANSFRTEDIPFLCAPKIFPNYKSNYQHTVHYPTPIDKIINEEALEPSPPKRLKLSPRQSLSYTPSILATPTVKRSKPEASSTFLTTTPQSILKVKSLSENGYLDRTNLQFQEHSTPQRTSGLGLSPRKPLAKHTSVRFEGLINSSSSSHDLTKSNNTSTLSELSQSIKQSSTDDEPFYSPENSIDENDKTLESKTCGKILAVEIPKLDLTSPLLSPKSDKGVKRSFTETVPVRSSPRFRKSLLEESENKPNENKQNEKLDLSPVKDNDSSNIIPKLKARKSLCRKVLETNTLRGLRSPVESPRKTNSTITSTKTQESFSDITYSDGKEVHSSSLVEKHSITETSFVETGEIEKNYSIEFNSSSNESMLNTFEENKTITESEKSEAMPATFSPYQAETTSNESISQIITTDKNKISSELDQKFVSSSQCDIISLITPEHRTSISLPKFELNKEATNKVITYTSEPEIISLISPELEVPSASNMDELEENIVGGRSTKTICTEEMDVDINEEEGIKNSLQDESELIYGDLLSSFEASQYESDANNKAFMDSEFEEEEEEEEEENRSDEEEEREEDSEESAKVVYNEIIEIISSSEEEEKQSEDSSSSYSSDSDINEIDEKNIKYESDSESESTNSEDSSDEKLSEKSLTQIGEKNKTFEAVPESNVTNSYHTLASQSETQHSIRSERKEHTVVGEQIDSDEDDTGNQAINNCSNENTKNNSDSAEVQKNEYMIQSPKKCPVRNISHTSANLSDNETFDEDMIISGKNEQAAVTREYNLSQEEIEEDAGSQTIANFSNENTKRNLVSDKVLKNDSRVESPKKSSVRNIYHTLANLSEISDNETFDEDVLISKKNEQTAVSGDYGLFEGEIGYGEEDQTVNNCSTESVKSNADSDEVLDHKTTVQSPEKCSVRNIYQTFANLSEVKDNETSDEDVTTLGRNEQTAIGENCGLFEGEIGYGEEDRAENQADENIRTNVESDEVNRDNLQSESSKNNTELCVATPTVDEPSVDGFDLFESDISYDTKNTTSNSSKITENINTKIETEDSKNKISAKVADSTIPQKQTLTNEEIIDKSEAKAKKSGSKRTKKTSESVDKQSPTKTAKVEVTVQRRVLRSRTVSTEEPKLPMIEQGSHSKSTERNEEKKNSISRKRQHKPKQEKIPEVDEENTDSDQEIDEEPEKKSKLSSGSTKISQKRTLRSRTVSSEDITKNKTVKDESDTETQDRKTSRKHNLQSIQEASDIDDAVRQPQRRVLRSRTVSTEEQKSSKEVETVKTKGVKRTKSTETLQTSKKEVEPRSRRAVSVQPELGLIKEEEMPNTRLTRRQINLLKNVNNNKQLDQLNPVVLLEKKSFESETDPNEETPSTSSSTTSTSSNRRNMRKLRSGSQTPEPTITEESSAIPVKKRGGTRKR